MATNDADCQNLLIDRKPAENERPGHVRVFMTVSDPGFLGLLNDGGGDGLFSVGFRANAASVLLPATSPLMQLTLTIWWQVI